MCFHKYQYSHFIPNYCHSAISDQFSVLLISELFLVEDIDLDIIDFLFDTIEKSKIFGL